MKEKFKEHIGKYCLDVSKMIFGGVVLSSIMKEDVNFVTLLLAGTFSVIATATAGFLILSLKTEESNNKN